MINITHITLILFLVAIATATIYTPTHKPRNLFEDANKEGHIPCATEWVYQNFRTRPKLGLNAACPTHGKCDEPAVRQGANAVSKTLRYAVTVFVDDNGKIPHGLSMEDIEKQLARTEHDFENYGINLEQVQITTVKPAQTGLTSHDNCLPPMDPTEIVPKWIIALDEAKNNTAYKSDEVMNVYISCMDQLEGSTGILLGVGSFPWQEDALKSTGGLWINTITTLLSNLNDDKTLQHEIGHTLGLWHTFHGERELIFRCSNPCYEFVHTVNNATSDTVGDFCADTPATPLIQDCKQPTGSDCAKTKFTDTKLNNIMGYSSCQSSFTTCQQLRMHCWINDKLSSWLEGDHNL